MTITFKFFDKIFVFIKFLNLLFIHLRYGSPSNPAWQVHFALWSVTEQIANSPHWLPIVQGLTHFSLRHACWEGQSLSLVHSATISAIRNKIILSNDLTIKFNLHYLTKNLREILKSKLTYFSAKFISFSCKSFSTNTSHGSKR